MKPVRRSAILSDGRERPWFEYIPEGREKEKLPLVFCLHGGVGDGYHAFECCGLTEAAKKYPMLVVSPYIDDIPRSFEFDMGPESEFMKRAKEFFDAVCRTYQGRYDRIYIAGYSIGEMAAFRFCREYGALVDAFIGAVGPAPRETFMTDGEICTPDFGLPAFIWRGSADYSYALYQTGREDDAVQNRVCGEYKEYWMMWNRVSACRREDTGDFLTEIYTGGKAPLIHVTAAGKRHEDEADVLGMAWEKLILLLSEKTDVKNVIEKDRKVL